MLETRSVQAWDKKGKPIMVLKADAWFHDFSGTAIRNLERMGIPRSVAKLMVGHKTDSVYERYNVASKRDLDVAREKMERNAMQCNAMQCNAMQWNVCIQLQIQPRILVRN